MKRRRVYRIIQAGYLEDKPSLSYDFALMAVVLVNLFIAVFDTFPKSEPWQHIIQAAETVTVLFFTVDYVLLIWTADYIYEQKFTPAKARLKFIFSPTGIVDFLSCIPYFFLPVFYPPVLWSRFPP